MKNLHFLVEGHLEKIFLENICTGSKVQRVITNGHTVSVKTLAKCMADYIKIGLRAGKNVIVILDREKRKISIQEITAQLLGELEKQHSIKSKHLHIYIADRMIENWIIAGQYDDIKIKDGYCGKAKIKEKVKGYNETTDGVRLLRACIPSKIAQKSPSFKRLYDDLSQIANCWWLQKKQSQ